MNIHFFVEKFPGEMSGYRAAQLSASPMKLSAANLTALTLIECAARCNVAFLENSRFLLNLPSLYKLFFY